jgi:hypothetical protein
MKLKHKLLRALRVLAFFGAIWLAAIGRAFLWIEAENQQKNRMKK